MKNQTAEVEELADSKYNGRGMPRLQTFFIVSIILMTLLKLCLTGSGFKAFPDESRYTASGRALEQLVKRHPTAAIQLLFSTQARPGDALIRMIPNVLQVASSRLTGLNHYESRNSWPLFIFNVIVYCLILIVLFRLSEILLRDRLLSLISVFLYSTLVNSYMYIRHALGYDPSLLILLYALYKIVRHSESGTLTIKNAGWIGVLSFSGYLVYPGYFPLVVVGLLLVFLNNLSRSTAVHNLLLAVGYGAGCLACLGLAEAVSRLGGTSYIESARTASAMFITQGSFEESFSVLFKYLFEVEGVSGLFLVIGLVVFFFRVFARLLSRSTSRQTGLIIAGCSVAGVYLTYAVVGYFFHQAVFYGRLLHQYFPLFCIFSAFALGRFLMNGSAKKQTVILVAATLLVLNFGINLKKYAAVGYPRDSAWEFRKSCKTDEMKYMSEYRQQGWPVFLSEKEKLGCYDETEGGLPPKVIIVNGCFIWPVDDLTKYKKFEPDRSYRLLSSRLHFLSLKAYQYEGSSIAERRNLDIMKLRIRVYSR